eukprot:CAMPEP_0179117348 /NCGR_PEP_ID=MMETSP0796-20121207/55111_1 /TAXON_ID=73915 /ORGANISM="Pyrodinium bahamense, Strain pbaha01" /LENGTH=488 /DNA_ID=CAMNT_0020815711 /DNA_START=21 /DNA_END=1488 /DNA_ORIENTATION=-
MATSSSEGPQTCSLVFPPGFTWGAATASYQIEGGATEGGRTPCIWDTFSAKPGNVLNGDTGAVACDHYHRWREDVRIMKSLGLPAYRFSLSWPRILPKGRGAPNPEALAFYNGLINELRAAGIEPLVTLYHWDLPQCLEEEYGGWLGRQVVRDFEHYAKTCFAAFGDRVTSWITLNEPWSCAVQGYATGDHAPGRTKARGQEPYLAAHHMLLAHARAVKRYRSQFQSRQNGRIGIVLNAEWMEPATDKASDFAAAQRALDWHVGWFADPIWKGHYPESMRVHCGAASKFTDAERELVKGSADFLGLNNYGAAYVSAHQWPVPWSSARDNLRAGGYVADLGVEMSGDSRWARTDMGWGVVPWGLCRVCEYAQERYQPSGGIIVTENGCAVREDTADAAIEDNFRATFLQMYLAQVHKAIQKGADVRGYFVWSLLDNFEWEFGYGKRFGIVRVDYKTQERTVKGSARMFAKVARTNVLRIPERTLLESNR